MCGRFTVKATWAELVALYRLTTGAPPHNLRPRYNVCPTDPVDVVTAEEGKRELIPMRWGPVPRWWNKPLKELRVATFNARAETVETKPFFRDAFRRTRCLIPMSGYFEWQPTGAGKQPWYFSAAAGSPLLTAAGLWDEWKDRATGEQLKSCTMIITKPNHFVAEVHDRTPVLLTEDQFAPWLHGEAGTELLKPAPNDYLQRWPVSKRVNSSKADADDATLIEPVETMRAELRAKHVPLWGYFNIDRPETNFSIATCYVVMVGSLRKPQRYSLLLVVCVTAFLNANSGNAEVASVYGEADGHCGTPTANGEHVDCTAFTAAHRTLPFGTHVRICRHGCVIVRINDRGPFVRGRDIDLTPAAAQAIGLKDLGRVTIAMER